MWREIMENSGFSPDFRLSGTTRAGRPCPQWPPAFHQLSSRRPVGAAHLAKSCPELSMLSPEIRFPRVPGREMHRRVTKDEFAERPFGRAFSFRARQDAAPPEVAQDLLNKHRMTSGGAASSRAMAEGARLESRTSEDGDVAGDYRKHWLFRLFSACQAPRGRDARAPTGSRVREAVFMLFNVFTCPGPPSAAPLVTERGANSPAGTFVVRSVDKVRLLVAAQCPGT
jgi:hypothetical protein